MNEKLNELIEMQKQISNQKKELVKKSGEAFESWCKDFFEQNSDEIKSFGWTQYTPYFNDGDTCTFSVDTDYLFINGDYIDECNWMDKMIVKSWGTYNRQLKVYEGRVEEPNPDYDEKKSELVKSIKNFLSIFDDDFYLSKFGDHALITVSKKGFDVDEYEHD